MHFAPRLTGVILGRQETAVVQALPGRWCMYTCRCAAMEDKGRTRGVGAEHKTADLCNLQSQHKIESVSLRRNRAPPRWRRARSWGP